MVSLLSGTDLSSSFPPTAAGLVLPRRPFSVLSHAMVLTSYLPSMLTSVSYELHHVEKMLFKMPKAASETQVFGLINTFVLL